MNRVSRGLSLAAILLGAASIFSFDCLAAATTLVDDAADFGVDTITDVDPGPSEDESSAGIEPVYQETNPDHATPGPSTETSAPHRLSNRAGSANKTEASVNSSTIANTLSLNYFALAFGPSLGSPGAHQSTPDGEVNLDAPIEMRNFLGLGWNFSDNVALTGTFYWAAQALPNHPFEVRDPFLRLSHASIFNWGGFNLYGDVRIHFPISTPSRNADMLASAQTFQMLTWEAWNTGLTLGLWGSLRGNYFGSQGVGTDIEAYASPNITFQVSHRLALQVLYQINASHAVGTPFRVTTDSVNVEPGLIWDITNNLMFNPYIRLHPYNGITLNNTSVGMFLNWKLI